MLPTEIAKIVRLQKGSGGSLAIKRKSFAGPQFTRHGRRVVSPKKWDVMTAGRSIVPLLYARTSACGTQSSLRHIPLMSSHV